MQVCVSGITMVFVPSMSEFVIADMLGGGKVYISIKTIYTLSAAFLTPFTTAHVLLPLCQRIYNSDIVTGIALMLLFTRVADLSFATMLIAQVP